MISSCFDISVPPDIYRILMKILLYSDYNRMLNGGCSMKVLSFGSLNIDNVYSVDHFVGKGETLSSLSYHVFTGGKGLNQSIALARAGAETYHAGSIGPDGQFLVDTMKAAGVHTDYVSVLPGAHTGHAIIQRDITGDNCILLYGGTNQMITREQADSVLSHFEKGDYMVLQNEINELSYIVKQAHSKGMVIVLNPSPMNEKILRLPLEDIDIFLLNEVEAGQLLDTSSKDKDELAEGLRKKFPDATIVLTLGGDGSVCISKEGIFRQGIYRVKVADTTAAGDTYTGFFIGSLLKGKGIPEAMRYASAASAIAVSQSGAAPSIPTEDEVEDFLKEKG